MSVVLITGAATGIGNLAAQALAGDGHTVFASVRDLHGANAEHAHELTHRARQDGVDIRVLELDVLSQTSANVAVAAVLEAAGQLDVVIHNAGHLYLGYVEAFTAEELAHVFDVNALGLQRVNRAALPHMRARRFGTLIYVGSTTTVSVPPFLGPYVASKFAFDALAHTTAYEVSQFGIETTIVMPGAFTKGTAHFPSATPASDSAVTEAYSLLDPMVARNKDATEALYPPGVDADPMAVAREIARVVALPPGQKPFRTVIDFTETGVDEVNAAARRHQERFLSGMGFSELLELKRPTVD